jgi:hypothetical protein
MMYRVPDCLGGLLGETTVETVKPCFRLFVHSQPEATAARGAILSRRFGGVILPRRYGDSTRLALYGRV